MNDSKRIAVNTLLLYFKLIITTIVNLIASRLILKALGASDYGLYSVVGGLVSMLNILGVTMVSTSYRYISVEIGKGDNGNPQKIFNTLFVVHFSLALLLVLLGESLGVYYINSYLNVDPSKISDAVFVLHISIISTFVSILAVPFNGVIIAREKFAYTALLEIIDVLLKFGMVIWLSQSDSNRLRLFALIMMCYSFFMSIGYISYCFIKEKPIIKWTLNKNWNDYKNVFSFSTWILIGAIAAVGKIQGASIILNWFFGTVLNAAMGLANQVNTAVSSFVRNLTQAANPQIMKNVGSGDEQRSMNIVYVICKFSYYIMLFPLIPVIFYVNEVLMLWLSEPPKYTSLFVIFFLLAGLVCCIHSGFDASIQASGNIKRNQIGYTVINLSLLPLMYICYKLGLPPYSNAIIMVLLEVIMLIYQCVMMKEVTIFSYNTYLRQTLLPALYTTALVILPLVLFKVLIGSSLLSLLAFVIVSSFWTICSIWLVGLSKKEKEAILSSKLVQRMNSRFINR